MELPLLRPLRCQLSAALRVACECCRGLASAECCLASAACCLASAERCLASAERCLASAERCLASAACCLASAERCLASAERCLASAHKLAGRCGVRCLAVAVEFLPLRVYRLAPALLRRSARDVCCRMPPDRLLAVSPPQLLTGARPAGLPASRRGPVALQRGHCETLRCRIGRVSSSSARSGPKPTPPA
jgi:hypothetical protein